MPAAGMLHHIGKKYGRLLVLEFTQTKISASGWKTHYFKCLCDCGRIKEINIKGLQRGSSVSCGLCIKEYYDTKETSHLGERFTRLVVIGKGKRRVGKTGRLNTYLLCRCDCGKEKEINECSLLLGYTKSCGCLLHEVQDLTGQKFGKLTVLRPNIDKRGSCGKPLSDVICECGRETSVMSADLLAGKQKACGHCGLSRNGKSTSWIALKLNEMIPEGIHNYFTDVPSLKRGTLNVDIALPLEKIAIEYDSIKYHGTMPQLYRDIDKTNQLTRNGWKVLRIMSNGRLPEQAELDNYLQQLRDGKPLLIVRLK